MRILWFFQDGSKCVETKGNLPKVDDIVFFKTPNRVRKKYRIELVYTILETKKVYIKDFNFISQIEEEMWFELEEKIRNDGKTLGDIDWTNRQVSVHEQYGEVILEEIP